MEDMHGAGASFDITTPEGTFDTEFYCIVDVLSWFTTIDEVRSLFGPEELVRNITLESQILSGAEENSLQFSNVEAGSEVVKKITECVPPDTLTMSDYTAQSLTHSQVVVGKVKVFASVGEDVFLENSVDYEIDYYKGIITLIEPDFTAGTATPGSAVLPTFDTEFYCEIDVTKIIEVHYEYYTVFVKGTDYTINYMLGRIARKYNGDIESGDLVYIDYKITQLADDALIRLSIDMTHEWILIEVGSSYSGSSDKKLRYAEANLAVARIAKSVLSKVINEGLAGSPNIHNISNNLKRIEESFRVDGMQFLQSFVTYGVSSGGQVQQNAIFA